MSVLPSARRPAKGQRNAARLGRLSLAAIALGAAYWRVRHITPYRPVVEHVSIPLPSGHKALSGLKIGFLTDIHAGPFIDASHVAAATALLAAEAPDLLLLGGDYVSESPRHLEASIPILAELSQRAPLGTFAVLGNHDIFVSTESVTSALESAGILTLRNELRGVDFGGTTLQIAGIDDTIHGRPDLDRAFAGSNPNAATIVLWHEPEFAHEAAARGAILQLSGHTHGGQVRLPGIRPVWLPIHGRKHIMGLEYAGKMPVYTSRGVGVYRPPIRLNCPPEVTLVTLV